MKLVGFGVVLNGKPSGIWPMPMSEAQNTARRYIHNHGPQAVAIVPVYTGQPLAVLPQAEEAK